VAKTVFDVLIEKVRHEVESANESLIGGAKDFAEYKELCGFIRGLQVAEREINDLSRNYMEGEDD
jgi:hypothetical protein